MEYTGETLYTWAWLCGYNAVWGSHDLCSQYSEECSEVHLSGFVDDIESFSSWRWYRSLYYSTEHMLLCMDY